MVGSLMYLTASRPDLVFDVCMCARYQAKPTKKHLEAIKRIFRYLKGTINMGLCNRRTMLCSLTSHYVRCGPFGMSGSEKEVRRKCLSFLEIDWLAGHQRSKEARPSQQQRRNTLQCLDAMLKSFG
ncbi:hypothetical protein Tco_0002646 [Tanacetum coccineum]